MIQKWLGKVRSVHLLQGLHQLSDSPSQTPIVYSAARDIDDYPFYRKITGFKYQNDT